MCMEYCRICVCLASRVGCPVECAYSIIHFLEHLRLKPKKPLLYFVLTEVMEMRKWLK